MKNGKKPNKNKNFSIIEVIPISYFLLDPAGKILRVNYFFRSLSGYSKKEIIGKNFQEIITTPNFIFLEFIEKYRSTKYMGGIELKLKSKNGKIMHILLNVSFLKNLIQCVFIDLSEKIFEENTFLIERLITVCSNCKKIKSSQGEWKELESFFGEKIQTRFSHGLCPKCVGELYSPYLEKK